MTLEYNLEELERIAQHIIQKSSSKILLFHGHVGTGKTTLIKALVKSLGSTDTVSSPTFSLVNEYSTATRTPIYHFDLYRIQSEEELYTIGIETYLESTSWIFIEWPKLIYPFLQGKVHNIHITHLDNTKRTLSLDTSYF